MGLQLQHSPSNEYSGLISFRINWFDLLAVQGTLKNLLQQPSSKASILQCSAFFMVQLSHQYMTTGKIIALTILIFVNKVMSLLFNMLSRLVIAFTPRSKTFNFMASVASMLLQMALFHSFLWLNSILYLLYLFLCQWTFSFSYLGYCE